MIVRDEDAGHVDFVVQTPQPAPQLLPHLGVQRTERLVQQQHLRLDGQRPGERDPLPLAAGELMRIALGHGVQLHELQQAADAIINRRAGGSRAPRSHAQAESHVFKDRHVPKERIVLKDEAYLAIADLPPRNVLFVE